MEGAVLFMENSGCVYVSVCGLLEMDWGPLDEKKKEQTVYKWRERSWDGKR